MQMSLAAKEVVCCTGRGKEDPESRSHQPRQGGDKGGGRTALLEGVVRC